MDRIVGFDQLGASDDFPTSAVRSVPPIALGSGGVGQLGASNGLPDLPTSVVGCCRGDERSKP